MLTPAEMAARVGGRTLVLGVLNVTPDSFSDGGRWSDPEQAIVRGLAMADEGADLVDVGGESTRPGAVRPSGAVEAGRVVPVVRELAAAAVTVSVDTMRAEIAAAAVRAGAVLVNDVSGGLADPAMLTTVADLGVPVVLMHWRGPSAVMAGMTHYDDVVTEVADALAGRADAAVAAGVAPDRIVLDPGLGFAKQSGHNWALLQGLDRITALGFPVLVGASRKRFLGSLLAGPAASEPRPTVPEPRPATGRDDATTALSALLAARGVWGVRVHAVRASADAVRVAAAVRG